MAADPSTVSAGPDQRAGDFGVCAGLVLATIATYAGVRHFQFVAFDDPVYPLNYHLRQGLTPAAVKWAFTTTQGANWHPLTWLSHLLDYRLYGPQAGPDHITSLILHVLASLMIFFALRSATGALWRSALVSFLFALHPLHVESVAWVSERKDVLCAFFWFLTLWTWVRYARSPSWRRYLAVFPPLCLGLLSKPMIVTLPFVLLLFDLWPLGRRFSARLVLEKVPLLGLSAASSAITFLVQRSQGATMMTQTSLGLRVENALVSVVVYIGKMIWPAKLAFLYPYPAAIPLPEAVLCGLGIAAVSILAVRFFRRFPYLAVGWFWFLGTLVPVIGLVQVGVQARADRYMYVPMVGLSIMLAWGAGDLANHWPRAKAWTAGALALASMALIPITWMQLRYWENSESLFVHAIRVTDNNFVAYHNLGVVLVAIPGRTAEGLAALAAEIRIRPNSAEAYTDLGLALRNMGRPRDAIREYRTALRIDANYAEAHNNLGAALEDMGLFPEALGEYGASVRFKPNYADGHNNLGAALARIGRSREALAEDEAALRIDPDLAAAHYNRAGVLLKTGLLPEAVSELRTALQIQPNDAKAHNVLGVALLQTEGRSFDGMKELEEAVRIDPNLADAHANLALALAQVPGSLGEAIGHIRTALGIRRDPRWENLLRQMEQLRRDAGPK